MANVKKVVHLTSAHLANDVRIFRKECRSLAGAGYEVVLVAPHPRDEYLDGVQIRGVTPPKNRASRMLLTTLRVLRAALRERGDIYHFHDPELMPVGVFLKLHGKRVIYDAHEELAKDILSKEWVPVFLRPMLSHAARLIEAAAVRCYDGVAAATPAIARQFPADKTILLQNFAQQPHRAVVDYSRERRNPPTVVYVGGLCRERGIVELVTAMSLLPESLGVRLGMAGWFDPPEFGAELAALPGWSRVDYLGKISLEETARLLQGARAGMVTFLATPNLIESQPTKIFEYMAAGLPVVASDFPWWREMIGGAGCGRLVNPAKPSEIAEAICWLIEHPEESEEMGRRGQRAWQQTYKWEHEAERLLALYDRLLSAGAGADRAREHPRAPGQSRAA
jgi:glycosyltransferase involved in cell wall biosynthesis